MSLVASQISTTYATTVRCQIAMNYPWVCIHPQSGLFILIFIASPWLLYGPRHHHCKGNIGGACAYCYAVVVHLCIFRQRVATNCGIDTSKHGCGGNCADNMRWFMCNLSLINLANVVTYKTWSLWPWLQRWWLWRMRACSRRRRHRCWRPWRSGRNDMALTREAAEGSVAAYVAPILADAAVVVVAAMAPTLAAVIAAAQTLADAAGGCSGGGAETDGHVGSGACTDIRGGRLW